MKEKQIFKAKFNEEKQEILAPVLVPDEVDFDGHTYTEEEVSKAKQNYVSHCNKANLQHSYDLNKDQAEFTEHYITPADMTINDQLVKKGTWMARMVIKSKALWKAVKDKTFTGFSVQGKALHRAIAKAKVAGRTETKAEFSLSDFRFDEEDCHIALVDEAANATEILVMKTKKQEEQTPVNQKTEPDKGSVKPKTNTEGNMSEDKNKKQEELELEVQKAKADKEALEKEIQKEKADKEALEQEVQKYKADKEKSEKEAFVSKAKADMKNVVEDAEAEALFVVKSLCPDQYEVISKALAKADTAIENMEIVGKPHGSSDKGASNGTVEERVVLKSKELMKEDPSLSGAQARDKARQIMRKDGTLTQD